MRMKRQWEWDGLPAVLPCILHTSPDECDNSGAGLSFNSCLERPLIELPSRLVLRESMAKRGARDPGYEKDVRAHDSGRTARVSRRPLHWPLTPFMRDFRVGIEDTWIYFSSEPDVSDECCSAD